MFLGKIYCHFLLLFYEFSNSNYHRALTLTPDTPIDKCVTRQIKCLNIFWGKQKSFKIFVSNWQSILYPNDNDWFKEMKKKHANLKKKQLLTGTVNAFLFTDRGMLEKKNTTQNSITIDLVNNCFKILNIP